MTYRRILVALDDSPAGLDAARAAIELATDQGATVRAVIVLHDHLLTRAVGGSSTNTSERLAAGALGLLRWFTEAATESGVACEAARLEGDPFRQILDEAESWGADLIVMGRSDRTGPSSPYLGSETAHVLEFADRPVLVVPRAVDGDPADEGPADGAPPRRSRPIRRPAQAVDPAPTRPDEMGDAQPNCCGDGGGIVRSPRSRGFSPEPGEIGASRSPWP